MSATTRAEDRYLRFFDQRDLSAAAPGWLAETRKTAIGRFAELGFPTKKHEDWKFTNVAPIVETEFAFESEVGRAPSEEDLEEFWFPDVTTHRLVFVNGQYAPALSSVGELPDGVTVKALSEVGDEDREILERHIAAYADYHNDAFTALNTALFRDGGYVHIERGTIFEEPVHLLFLSTETAEPLVTFPRSLIVAEEDCQASVVEEYASLTDGVYFSDVVTEVVAGDNAVLSHTVIERESPNAFNVGTLRLEQGRTSNVSSHTVLLGGQLVRNNVHPVLAGEGAYCMVNGLFVPRDRQHMDNFMRVEHAAPHGDSRQYYNGILDDYGHGVFAGRIVVHQPAQRTDAKQENRNILLSRNAQVDSKPQLEIYADDVKCTHGATIGQLDKNWVFYLRSRGIPAHEARRILLLGFARECLERMRLTPVRRYVESLVERRIPAGEDLAGTGQAA